jgi:hypothetical protein
VTIDRIRKAQEWTGRAIRSQARLCWWTGLQSGGAQEVKVEEINPAVGWNEAAGVGGGGDCGDSQLRQDEEFVQWKDRKRQIGQSVRDGRGSESIV